MSVEWSPSAGLAWSDFEADPHPGAYQDALATIRYGCTWNVRPQDGRGAHFTINGIRLTTLFVKNLSWVRAGLADAHLLRHVQGCFDLAEEARPQMELDMNRRFENRPYRLRGKGEDEQKQNALEDSRVVLRHLETLRREVLEARIREYESETQYGQDPQEQAKYDERFARLRAWK